MIKLNRSYYIDVDEYNFTLKKKTRTLDKKTNEPIYKTLGYYTTLSYALKAARQLQIKEAISDKDLSLKETIEIIDAITKEFDKMVSENIKDN